MDYISSKTIKSVIRRTADATREATYTHTHRYTYRMQSQDCWYWTPVAVAVTPWMVSDSRWTVGAGSEVKRTVGDIQLKCTMIVTHSHFLSSLCCLRNVF